MARRPALGGFSLDLFGGGGVDAGVFNIASESKQNEAYLALVRVETQWEGGLVNDDTYLGALQTYAETFPADSAERLNKMSSLEQTKYRIQRNVLTNKVDAGTASLSDLLAFDQSKLAGLDPNNQEYLDREGRLNQTQNALFNEEEKKVVDRYQAGKMTTTQLRTWYKDQLSDPRFGGNNELTKGINDRVTELNDRVTDERDAATITKYNQGKISPTAFLNYATAARGRYADGSTQAKDWDQRIDGARDASIEDDLSYRYSLSQDYLRLKEFVQSNKGGGGGGGGGSRTYTSHQTRTVLGADGKWHVRTTAHTTTKQYAPSPGEQQAYAKRQGEVARAEREMNHIENKLTGLAGGFVGTDDMLGYYHKQLAGVAKGSQEWYSIQSKIDNLHNAKQTEKALSHQGVKLSFPPISSEAPERYRMPGKTSGQDKKKAHGGGHGGGVNESVGKKDMHPAGGGGGGGGGGHQGDTSLEGFMHGIAKVESGGRYDARNKTTGAYGRYQILPSNWAAWAEKAGLGRNAEPTPANQEKVAHDRFGHLYHKYDGDYAKMAAEWFAGAGGAAHGNEAAWGPNTRAYVSHVLAATGSSYNPGRSQGQAIPSGGYHIAAPTGGGGGGDGHAGGGGGGNQHPAAQGGHKSASGATLPIITGIRYHDDLQARKRNAHMPAEDYMPYQGYQVVKTQDLPIPKGLDASQFRKLYDGIESAFEHGEEAATISLGGKRTLHIFIGDDPDQRIGFMREMDDMRVDLADTELKAYKGTASEATKTQSAIAARHDAGRHELLILDTAGTNKGSATTNPVAAGVRLLDKITSGITRETGLMNDAYARGDVTTAYLHAQAIDRMTSGLDLSGTKEGDLGTLVDLVNQATERIGKITGKAGLSADQLLSGGFGGGEFRSDMDRLTNLADEISKAAEPGAKTVALLDNQLKKDGSGRVVWTGSGPRAEVQLNDNQIRMVGDNGKITIVPTNDVTVDDGGHVTPAPPKNTVKTLIKTGNGVTEAFAKYVIGRVGTVTMPDGSKVPLMGKVVSVVTDQNNDGIPDSTSSYFENPLAPGKWSSTAIQFKAPAGTKTVFDQGGSGDNPSFQFPGANGNTVTLSQSRDGSGVYQTWVQPQGSVIQGPPPDPVLLGTGAQSPEAQSYIDAWTRDLSGVDSAQVGMSDMNAPAVGFTPEDWKQVTEATDRAQGSTRPDAFGGRVLPLRGPTRPDTPQSQGPRYAVHLPDEDRDYTQQPQLTELPSTSPLTKQLPSVDRAAFTGPRRVTPLPTRNGPTKHQPDQDRVSPVARKKAGTVAPRSSALTKQQPGADRLPTQRKVTPLPTKRPAPVGALTKKIL